FTHPSQPQIYSSVDSQKLRPQLLINASSAEDCDGLVEALKVIKVAVASIEIDDERRD
ncbi:hypothetical protein C5167_007848, partial [Papaver somniferum]